MDTYICERCGKPVTSKFGSGRFCSRACANARDHSDATKQKIRESLLKQPYLDLRFCNVCGKELNRRNSSGFCFECYKQQPKSEDAKLKQSETMKQKGYPRWNIHRNEPSYAEKFFMQVLQNNNIDFVFELAVPNQKNHFYYLDFYIEKNNYKIDLEIDGGQHKYREEHDQVRDKYLTDNGYIVYRIGWNNINSITGQAKMKQKIDSFIDFYNSL
jgi:very-short-patch-repair endonuclease